MLKWINGNNTLKEQRNGWNKRLKIAADKIWEELEAEAVRQEEQAQELVPDMPQEEKTPEELYEDFMERLHKNL
jgi:hypothetical protein